MICLGGYSRDIHLYEGATQLGVIAIRNGRIDRCFAFGIWGAEALYKLINLRRGRYKVNDATDMSASDASLAAHSWQELLIEAVRQEDEAEHALQSAASSGRVIAFPTPAGHAASFDSGPVFSTVSAVPTLSTVAAPVAHVASGPVPAPSSTATSSGVPRVVPEIDWSEPTEVSKGHADIAHLLEQATTCYLRRDLARAEALLQECLVLRPGDKRVLQNLERIRRKKSP